MKKIVLIVIVVSCIALVAAPAVAQSESSSRTENVTVTPNGTATTGPTDTAATATVTETVTPTETQTASPTATVTPTQTASPTESGASSNVSAPGGAPSAELVVDGDVIVTDYRYVNGQMVLTFWSSAYKSVLVAPRAGSSDSGTITAQAFVLDADRQTTVKIASPGGVSLWTDESVQNNNQFHFLRKPNTFFIRGPWSGSDVRDAGLGGALGVAIAVIYTAVAHKIGASERGERLA